MECTHCGSSKYIKNGVYKCSQRYRCKECNRYFSDKVRKFTYADKERFLEMYLNNVGIRKAAELLGCSPPLLVRWVRQFAVNLRRDLSKVADDLSKVEDDLPSNSLPEVIEMDDIYTRVKKGLACPGMGCLFTAAR
ncbi:MAG: hypothetical protein FWG85_02260 [Bacteroidetes bacterium]|nr:hypothetical protein [Bacteroidota bacterium]